MLKTPGDFVREAGARLIPRGLPEAAADPLYKGRDARLSRAAAREILPYCSTGGRSAPARDVNGHGL